MTDTNPQTTAPDRWRPMTELPLRGQPVWALEEGGAIHKIWANPELELRLYPCGWKPIEAVV